MHDTLSYRVQHKHGLCLSPPYISTYDEAQVACFSCCFHGAMILWCHGI